MACGLDAVLDFLERVRFTDEDIRYVASLGGFSPRFLDRLREFCFTGEVHAVPEGTPLFANEPILEVVAPIAQGQLIETLVMNQVHLQTVLASKAARVVAAAQGRAVVDFGARRMHGIDAALKAARAFYIAGVASTSNVVAGRIYGIPVAGTMAHSYIQAHDSEAEAFRAFAALYPDTILLVDTYDTLVGVRRVIDLARKLGDAFRVSAVRLDSGDLGALAKQSRALLDAAGLQRVKIFASGGLDEFEVDKLVQGGAPIDGFGVGTAMGVSDDVPALDIAYKLSEYAGKGRLKLSTGKPVLPGRKQIFRREQDGRAAGDVIGCDDEKLPGRPLMRTVMQNGRRLPEAALSLADIRAHAERELTLLPEQVRQIAPARPPYPVEISAKLQDKSARIAKEVAG
jgi:nicotinate phosphoribosyltransferase